jgi:hypothetical protein
MRKKNVFKFIDTMSQVGSAIHSFHRSDEGLIKRVFVYSAEVCIFMLIITTGIVSFIIGVDPND